jgi:protein-S-isoprenylcysteine O-methyltransferase Ste14
MNILNLILTSVLFLGYFLLWAIKRQELLKSAGVDANVISLSKRPIQTYFGALVKIMTIAIVVIIVLHTFFKDAFSFLHYTDLLDTLFIKSIGLIIGILGLSICRIAQVTIGKSWRVGIDEQSKPGLITKGIYRYMRNPTYTGLFLMCAGIWLINPTVLYGFWVFGFFLLMEFQVRCEEEYLETQYGEEYTTYCKKTKRYIPLIY